MTPHRIVFDLGGVLMKHDRMGCLTALQQLMPDEAISHTLGFGNECQDRFLERGHLVPGTTLRYRFETGDIPTEVFVSNVLSLCRPGTTQEQVIEAWNTIHAGIDEQTWEQLESLHQKGHRLYLMSNTDAIHWQHVLELYGERVKRLFDGVFLSFEEGLVKPDAAFFETVHKRIAAPDSDVLFVDDMDVNRLAAQQSVGWKTFATVASLPR